MNLIEELRTIAETKNVKLNFSQSLNYNPQAGVSNSEYWLDAPALGVTGYYNLNEILKYIKVWKEENVKQSPQTSGNKMEELVV